MSTHENHHTEEVIDIEEYGKRGEAPPKGQQYRVRIDRETYVISHEVVSGGELLTLAGKTPVEQYLLHQRIRGSIVEVGINDPVDLTTPGVERFITQARDATEGLSERHDFDLPSNDREELEAAGYQYETVMEGGVRRLMIHDFPVIKGYNLDKVDLNLRIEAGYPDAQIDMAYFYPPLARADGKPIRALSNDSFDGKVWQRWSRHRTPVNPWRPGLDNILTHLAQVCDWLKRELEK